MDDTSAPAPKPVRRDARRTRRIIGTILLAVAIGAGGYWAGRQSVDQADPQAATCKQAEKSVQEHMDASKQAEDGGAAQTDASVADPLRQAVVVINQNGGCFDVDMREAAQSFLDREARNAANDANQAARCAGALNELDRFGC